MKACTFMFMVVPMEGPFRLFLNFSKNLIFGCFAAILGQTFPLIRNFYKVDGDIRLVGSRKDLRLQMRPRLVISEKCAIFFNTILN